MLHNLTYKCPNCSRPINREVDYPDYNEFVDSKNTEITISTWCPRCEATHLYSISINPKKEEGYRIKTHHLLLNGERTDCKLKIKNAGG